MIDYETVREIARQLPNVDEGLSYGAPVLKVAGKHLFAGLLTRTTVRG